MFQTLRNEVTSIQIANEGGKDVLIRYYVQSGYARDKFPVSETNVKLNFLWTDIFRPSITVSNYSWIFERANILFNLGVIESQLATTTNRDTPAGIEVAGKHFCASAGYFKYIRDEFSAHLFGTLSWDLTKEGLTMLVNLMLGQGQACYYEMARAKGMKAETCAKIAGQAADFYRAAANSVYQNVVIPNFASEIESNYPWIAYAQFYAACFDAASFFQYSQKVRADAESTGDGYGVEIAWLNVAENACRAALAVVEHILRVIAQSRDQLHSRHIPNASSSIDGPG
jgi:programmed cell death 6-interacting protein